MRQGFIFLTHQYILCAWKSSWHVSAIPELLTEYTTEWLVHVFMSQPDMQAGTVIAYLQIPWHWLDMT